MAIINQNIYLSTGEYSEEASTLASTCGGLVLTLGSTTINSGNESADIWTYEIAVYSHNEVGEMIVSYPDLNLVRGLERMNLIARSGALPVELYAAGLPDYYCMSEVEVLSSTAEILRAHGNYVVVLSSSTHTNGNTSGAKDGQVATSAVVKGIEKELGVNLEVDSDAALYSILEKSGAGPLSGLLKKAYGTENKKTEVKR
ncbi:MAG: hypothetical protein HYT27_03450 [Parcubacteria group bacterium]|nr:hypothetical protein [Parcubacteria group bacterium]